MLDILFRSAWESLQTLAFDPQFIGGRIGMLAMLHTWSQVLRFHPHLHCLIPAGGLTYFRDRWVPSHPTFFVPVKALSMLFRQSYQTRMKQTDLYDRIPSETWYDKWGIWSKVAGHGRQDVIDYLGRYFCRVAITNNRLERIDGGTVTFRYKNRYKGIWTRMTIPGIEFIRRFLQHILPRRFIKVRYYGLWHPSNREILDTVRCYLGESIECHSSVPSDDSQCHSVSVLSSPTTKPRHCRYYGSTNVTWLAEILPTRCRSP